MNINQAKQLIEQKGSEIPFVILKLIKIPEADILHCVYQSQKVNLKFDLGRVPIWIMWIKIG